MEEDKPQNIPTAPDVSTITTITTTRKVHVTKLEEWDRQDLDQFWCSVRLYIIGNRQDFVTDKDKIIFALLFMTKEIADAWAHNFINESLEHDFINQETWAKFEKMLKFVFADPNKKNSTEQGGKALSGKLNSRRVLPTI